ncbi:MAG: spermidine/putrescine transport system ATP-binding protein [Chthoniobacter sp.]|jgi:spermidine/putrescine transport system ATP-binding protein|nr:spermidine/putrescine transport system ATP-binding protein [Chthoniobacter sp.]
MDQMVELRNVTKRFGSFTAVTEVNLSIAAGEFLTLLGPSGCGKTTLLRMISGFEAPTDGTVWLNGEDVTHLPPYRRNVNQVFQSYALFPHLTVEENISFGLKMQKVPKPEINERVKEATALVSLGGMEQRKPSQLSGGQRQRVALARALICRPKVLLLDEPLSALDAKLRHLMQVELKRLQKKLGITFVFVTHDQEEALTMSDRIAVVNKGRIEQLGASSEIYHTPQTTFVADFIGKANILEATVLAEEGSFTRLRLASDVELLVPSESCLAGMTNLLVSIRPEKIHLQKAKPMGSNVFEAEVEEELFKGATDELELRTGGGLELTAVVANESATQETFHKGEKVWCNLHPSDIVVVRAE